MAHGRLYFASALGSIVTVALVYSSWQLIVSVWTYELAPVIWNDVRVGSNLFRAGLQAIAFSTGLGLAVLPSLAVWVRDWLSLDSVGATRRARVVGWMAASQFLFAPLILYQVWHTLIELPSLSGILSLVMIPGLPLLLPMVGLFTGLAATEERRKRETPAPETPAPEREVKEFLIEERSTVGE